MFSAIALAAVNSHRSCVLSGDAGQIRHAEAALRAAGVRVKLLDVSHGFHSADVDPCLPQLQRSVEELIGEAEAPSSPDHAAAAHTNARPRVISTLSCKVLVETPQAAHWVAHARQSVLFEAALESAVSGHGCSVVVELGMQAHLSPHVIAKPCIAALTAENVHAKEEAITFL